MNCPLAEWVVVGNEGEEDPIRPLFPYLEGAPLPKNGSILPSNEPGIGVKVREGWLQDTGDMRPVAPWGAV